MNSHAYMASLEEANRRQMLDPLEAIKEMRKEQDRTIRNEAAAYCKPFCEFLTDNPTVFHAVDAIAKQLTKEGFTKLSARDAWKLEKGGKYFVERNGSSLIAFVIGSNYEPGNGAAVLAGHVDALTTKLKPVSKVPDKAGCGNGIDVDVD